LFSELNNESYLEIDGKQFFVTLFLLFLFQKRLKNNSLFLEARKFLIEVGCVAFLPTKRQSF
jgi:hypothetical protein